MAKTGRHGKTTVGIRTTRTGGCQHQEHHEGMTMPRKAQVTGFEEPEQVELTFAQLRRLSTQHSDCIPSLECLAETKAYEASDAEEDEALSAVNDMRKQRGLTRLG